MSYSSLAVLETVVWHNTRALPFSSELLTVALPPKGRAEGESMGELGREGEEGTGVG